MKMQLEMGSMTEHDKKLLSLMSVVVLIVVLGGFVLYPLIQSNLELQAQLETAQEEKDACDQKITLLGSQQALHEALLEKRTAAAKDLYPWMESPAIDRMLTSIVLSRGMDARDLSITMPAGMTNISPYAYGETENETEPDTCSGVYAAEVSMTISGDEASLQQLMDDLYAEYPSIRITSYSWSTATVVGGGANAAESSAAAESEQAAVSGGKVYLILNLEIFMVSEEIPETMPDSAAQ